MSAKLLALTLEVAVQTDLVASGPSLKVEPLRGIEHFDGALRRIVACRYRHADNTLSYDPCVS